MAVRLNVSIKTIETHRKQLMERLDIHDVWAWSVTPYGPVLSTPNRNIRAFALSFRYSLIVDKPASN